MSRRKRRRAGKIHICSHGNVYVDNDYIPAPKLEDGDIWLVPVATRKMFKDEWYAGLVYIPCMHRFAHIILAYDQTSELSTFWMTKCEGQLVKISVRIVQRAVPMFGMVGLVQSPTLVFLSAQDYPGVIPECNQLKKEFMEQEIVR